ncbi:kinase-like domain-containing protein, partial [Lentinula raphanica]
PFSQYTLRGVGFAPRIGYCAHIHFKGICHRDLKPENLLLDIAGNLKISDFGLDLSAVFRLSNGKTRALSEHCRSLPYVAPELALDQPYAAEPIDLWGIGVVLFTLLAGNTPWDVPSKQSPAFRRYIKGDIFDENPWVRFDEDALSSVLYKNEPTRTSTVLADKLTESLRATGDVDYVLPAEPMDVDQAARVNDTNMDVDVDAGPAIRPPIAPAAGHNSQFTQSLLLFLMALVKETLGSLGIVYREYGAANNESNGSHAITPVQRIEMEEFRNGEVEGTFWVLSSRDLGNPLSWRQFFKAFIKSDAIYPFVLRKSWIVDCVAGLSNFIGNEKTVYCKKYIERPSVW